MAIYQYRCVEHGITEVRAPIGTAAPAWPCPRCTTDLRRVFTAPLLGLAPRALVSAIDRAEATASAPGVVTSPPPRRPPVAPRNPALRRLPRP
ncbi:zinc ribbon domain-containing protein [Pseudonocardia bannensis]|uniref:Zinc ribbon domain-containing protein n=2 Tax=Pseudonocardia bannensis TaxID=630973 RepID=A0A848DA56_9PSEU|nr:zinc ribbon domain-containing protein [Pseudonocardia bannensis]